MGWTKGTHAEGQVHQRTKKKMHERICAHEQMSMLRCVIGQTDEQTWKMCWLTNGWTNMHFLRTNELFNFSNMQERSIVEMHHQANPTTIEDSAHFSMQRWSYGTPWGHPSPRSTTNFHAHQQKHECTTIVISSHVMGHVIDISIVGHIVNQCNVTWKSKRPTCCMNSCKVGKSWNSNSHEGIRIAARFSFTLDYKYPLIFTCRGIFTSAPPT